MKVATFLDNLVTGVLGNLYMKPTEDEFDETRKKELMINLNYVLAELHTKFVLRERCIYLEEKESRVYYPLTKEHFINREHPEGDNDHYLWDEDLVHRVDPAFNAVPGEPETDAIHDDVIKVLSVVDNTGYTYSLNNDSDPKSLFTPSPTLLQVPEPVEGNILAITYQANHPKITSEEDEIDLPSHLMTALSYSIASNVLVRIASQEALQQAAMYSAAYQNILRDVIDMDTINASYSQTNTRFKLNGWI